MLTVPVKVTNILANGNFWVIEDDAIPSKYRTAIQTQEKEAFQRSKIKKSQLNMIVLYDNKGVYQRARIDQINNSTGTSVDLFLLDYGTYQTATLDELTSIPKDWLSIPFLAKEIVVHHYSHLPNSIWSQSIRSLLFSSEKVYLHPVRFEEEKILANIILFRNGKLVNLLSKIMNRFHPPPSIGQTLTSLHSVLREDFDHSFSVSHSGFASIATEMALRAKPPTILAVPKVENKRKVEDLTRRLKVEKKRKLQENLLKGHCPVRSSSEQKNRLMDSHSVYVSSHTPLRPITELTLPELSTSIIDARLIDSLVNELGISTPTKLQTWLWPAIANGHNSIIAMESRGISLTLGWLAPILSFVFEGQISEEVPEGGGPFVLVLVPSWSEGAFCESLAQQLTPSNVSCRTLLIHGLGRELECIWDLVNGVEILIATPSSFLRLLNESRFITSYSRLFSLVLQNSDQLLDRFPDELDLIVKKSLDTAAKRNLPIQFLTTTQTWKPEILKLALQFSSRPSIFISSPLEVVAATGIPLTFHTSRKSILSLLQGRCFVGCCSKNEAVHFASLIKDLPFEFLIAHEGCSQIQLERVQRIWSGSSISRKGLPIVLICSDQVADLINVRDVQRLFHLTLPTEKELFINRFVCLYKNIDLKENNDNSLQVHIVLQNKPDWFSSCLDILKNVQPEEVPVRDGELCPSLEAFGHCLDQQLRTCSKRHSFRPEIDLPLTTWPQRGDFVTLQLISILDGSRFACRLLALRSKEGGARKLFEKHLLEIFFSLKQYCDRYVRVGEKINWKLGDFCVVRPGKRARIISLGGEKAKIIFLEEAHVENVEVNQLLPLPSDKGILTPLVYQVLLCDLQPRDKETTWSPEVIAYMQSLFSSSRVQLKGQVRFVLGQSLWLQNLTIDEGNNSSGVKLEPMKPRLKLIAKKFALEDLYSSAKIEKLMQENKQEERITKESSSNKIKLNLLLENDNRKKSEKILEKRKTSLINACVLDKPQPKVNIQTKQAEVNPTENCQQSEKTMQVASSDGKVVYDFHIDDLNSFIETISKRDPKKIISEIKELEGKPLKSNEIGETKKDMTRTEQKPKSISYSSTEAGSSEFDDREYEAMLLRRFEKEANDLFAEIQKRSRTCLTWSLPFKKKATIAWGQDELFIYLKIYDDDIDRMGFYLRCFAQNVDYVSKEKAIRLELFGPIQHVDQKATGRYVQVKLLKIVSCLRWPYLLYDKHSENSGLIQNDHELLNSQINESEPHILSSQSELLLATSLTINQSAIPALESLGLELPALESGASSESEDEYEPIKRQL